MEIPPRPSSIFGESLALMKLFASLQNISQNMGEEELGEMGLTYEDIEGWLRDPYLHFKAWATSIAALHRPQLQSSLDFRLQDAVHIKEQVLGLLRTLHDSLIEVQHVLRLEQPNEWWTVGDPPKSRFEVQSDGTLKKIVPESDPSQQQSHETCDLKELLTSSKQSVSSLLKLSVAIRSSPARDDYAKAAARYNIPSSWDIGHVTAKHGHAKYSKPWLLKRLGEAITLRRKYLMYREEHNRKIQTRNEGLAEQATRDGHTVAPTATHTLPSTIATRMANAAQEAMEKVDITVADETARSQTSYEPTMYEGGESTRLTVPKPPEMAFEGVPFEYGKPFMCPYCFTEQNCRDRTVWKRHVFRDLKPYVCTFADCDSDLFSSQHDWFLHEIQKHRREWACQSCQRPPFQSSSALRNHLLSKHTKIAPKEELPDIVAQCEEPINRPTATDCPLCDDWEKSFAKSQYGGLSKLRKHLGRHMEQLALFALPRVEPDDNRSDGEGESDEEEEAEEVQVTDDNVIVPDQDGQLNDEEEDLSSRFSGGSGKRAPISKSEIRRKLEEREEEELKARLRERQREEEELKARLRERQMPRRRFSAEPGNRRHRVLYDDGVYRWE
ncbi:hypothetical protein DL95DRAFT_527644 [Leptodontidium sp. 2 PMI_412]|nr:hypothetical protein DL95DRAFT_527644 [Leptodontidium sp. 2 PMI_412]